MHIYKKTAGILFVWSLLFSAPQETVFLSIGKDTTGVVIPENIPYYLEETLKIWGNHGYPFTEMVLTRYETRHDTLFVHYRIHSGETVTLDTVVFGDFSKGEVKRLNRLIREDLTGLYHRGRIEKSIRRLQQVEWLTTENRHDISGNALRLYVEKVEDFSLDVLAAYQSEAGGLVGQVDLSWSNFLGLGRQADFYWYHPSERTNRVSVHWVEPFIFNSGFTAKLRFKQEHEDTLYVYRDSRVELIWQGRRVDVGVRVSQEDIYTTRAGELAGIEPGSRQVSAVNLSLDRPLGRNWRISLSSGAGIRTGGDTLQVPVELNSRIERPAEPFYYQLRILGGWLYSEGKISDYQLWRLGGGDFLRGALFEQYRTRSFTGISLEGGLNDGRMRAGLFGDIAFLLKMKDPLFHAGFSLSLPAGPSKIRILLGFDLKKPPGQGKIHVGWSF